MSLLIAAGCAWHTSMPTLCANAGPLPEAYRPFLNAAGELQVGDAFGLEAQWLIGEILSKPYNRPGYVPEMEWSLSEIEEDERGTGCTLCGDESADTIRGLCWYCS